MKTSNLKRGAASLALVGVLAAPVASSFAQEDLLLSETDQILNSDQIDIEGVYKEKKKPSRADRIAQMRKKLEQKNEQMMRKKIEDQRVKAEVELTKKLQNAFSRGFDAMNEESAGVGYSPVRKVEKRVVTGPKKNKVTLETGVTNISGNSIDVESNLNLGLGIETAVHENFSVGFGLSYIKMDARDIARSSYYYGQEVSYKKYAVEATGKYVFSNNSSFRPYVGIGFGYNKSKAKYNSEQGNVAYSGQQNVYYNGYSNYNNPYGYQNGSLYNYEDGFSSSYLSGALMIGSDIHFTESFGAGLQVKYNKALTTGYDKDLSQHGLSKDQGDLRNITGQIEEADQISINASMLYRF